MASAEKGASGRVLYTAGVSVRKLAATVVLAATLAVALVALPAPVAPAWAAPVVTVRARTRIEIERVSRSLDGIAVRGRVVEIGTSAPLPGLSLFVSIEGQERMTSTNRDGRFTVVYPLGEGSYTLGARFLGDEEYSESELVGFRFDVGKETPAIVLSLPQEVEAGRPLEGALETTVGGDPAPLRVTVSVGAAAGDLREVLRVDTDDAGRAAVVVPAADLGRAGDKRIKVEFKGDAAMNPVTAETTLRIVSTTRIDAFRAPEGTVPYEDRLAVSGRLVDEAGAGVPGQAITITAGGERVGGARTGDDGGFSAKLKASSFAPGDLTLAAEYVSTTPWRRGARTPPSTLRIAEPRPVPIEYTIGAFALTFAVVLGFVLARTRPWRPLLARAAKWRRRGRSPSGPAAAVPGGDPDAPPATGLKHGRTGLMSTLRRPADAIVSGTVRDVLTGRPVAGARLAFELEGQTALELVTAEDGRFEVGPLHAGTWKAHARAPGFVTERFAASVPHRGELREVRIDLLPVREQVFVIYRLVAYRLLPRRELWGVWTPREILDHVRTRRPTGALGALTDFVEEAYFSARTPDEDVLPVAQRRAAAARAELGGAADH